MWSSKRHVDADKPPFQTRHPPTLTFLTRRKDRFCSFPHRHDEATEKPETRDETRLAHQNEHFVRDILLLWQFAASKLTFFDDFFLGPENLQPQNRCFVRSIRQCSAHVRKCHAGHGICTLSPLDAALPMIYQKHATGHV